MKKNKKCTCDTPLPLKDIECKVIYIPFPKFEYKTIKELDTQLKQFKRNEKRTSYD